MILHLEISMRLLAAYEIERAFRKEVAEPRAPLPSEGREMSASSVWRADPFDPAAAAEALS